MVEIIDNTPTNTLFLALKALFPTTHQIQIAVGYFYLNGWNSIKDYLPENPPENFIQILIGQELEATTFQEIDKGYRLRYITSALDDLSEIAASTEQNLNDLYQLIKNKVIDFRIYCKGRLHSKLYLFIDNPAGLSVNTHKSPGTAIVGSSNFTVPGTAKNKELNTEFTDRRAIIELKDWFDDLWANQSEEFREDLIKIINLSKVLKKDQKNPVGKYVSPKTLFKYLTWIWLHGKIEPINKEDILAEFQMVGVINAIDVISKFHGVIIADSVGLGKSFIGATIIEEFALGKLPTWQDAQKPHRNILMILPPNLIPQWRELLKVSGDFFPQNYCKYSRYQGFPSISVFSTDHPSSQEIAHISFLSLGKFQKYTVEEIYQYEFHKHFDLILIDEAHKFRNRGTKRFNNIQALRFKQENNPFSHRNKFALLTATPINNNIGDIFNLISIFSDDSFTNFKRHNIPITTYFRDFNEIKRKWEQNEVKIEAVIKQAQKIKDNVFKQVLILRNRKYIIDQFGKEGKIKIRDKEFTFIEPVPEKVTYEKNISHSKEYNEFLSKAQQIFLDLNFTFTKLYSTGFVAISKSDILDQEHSSKDKYMVAIGAILEFLLAKRLESSIFSFERTLTKLYRKNNIYLSELTKLFSEIEALESPEKIFEKFQDFANKCMNIADKTGSEETFTEDEEFDLQDNQIDPRIRLMQNLIEVADTKPPQEISQICTSSTFFEDIAASEYFHSFLQAFIEGLRVFEQEIKSDKLVFEELIQELENLKQTHEEIIKTVAIFQEENREVSIPIYNDPKIAKLKQIIHEELVGKKYIIFTQYKDTALYIYHTLYHWIQNQARTLAYLFTADSIKLRLVTGGLTSEQKERIIANFAPNANNNRSFHYSEEIQILVSTDTLSEGVNLQDAHGVINFDLPWNPMRIVQRVGRVNRIGNEKEIFVKNFSPTQELETIIGILEKLNSKIQDITALVGKEYYILSTEEEIKPEVFEQKINRLANANLDQLEEMTKVGDAQFIGDFDYKEEMAKYRLLNYIQNELNLTKNDFDEIQPYLQADHPIYTLTQEKALVRFYEITRGDAEFGHYILKDEMDQITIETSDEIMALWTAEEKKENLDLTELEQRITRLDKYFEKEIFYNLKGISAQPGILAKLMLHFSTLKRRMRDSQFLAKLNINMDKFLDLLVYLPLLELNTHQKHELTTYLEEKGCIDQQQKPRNNQKLIDELHDYFNISGDLTRKLEFHILGWRQ